MLKQIINGFKELEKNNVMHRDIKLPNLFLHFPDKNLFNLDEEEKKEFLKTVDLSKTRFEIKIADFGFAKQVDYL